MNLPVIQLHACYKDKVASHTSVLNLQGSDQYIYISLPEEVCCPCIVLLDVVEVQSAHTNSIYSEVFREGTRPWIRLKTDALNLGVGLHTYRLNFVSTASGLEFTLWVQYIIQDDDPPKPYIYMHRE